MGERKEHCYFKKLDVDGVCIAYCKHAKLVNGVWIDCAGKESSSVQVVLKRIERERKFH